MGFDNPASTHPSLKSRVLTFNYLTARHAALLLLPHPLCFDWSMGSVPLVHAFGDVRNALTLFLLLLLTYACARCLGFLARRDLDSDGCDSGGGVESVKTRFVSDTNRYTDEFETTV